MNVRLIVRVFQISLLLKFSATCGSFCMLSAGEVQLKNGTLLRGNIYKLEKMNGRKIVAGRDVTVEEAVLHPDPVTHSIILIENTWQKIYVPRGQIPDEQFNFDVGFRPVVFNFSHLKKNQTRIIAAVGTVQDVESFDEYGRRGLTLLTPNGPLPVVQAITRIEPDHVVLEGVDHKWKTGMTLRAIPISTIITLVKRQIRSDDASARLSLVSFYRQAGFYPQAFEELDHVAKDFPDQRERCEDVRRELADQFGREVLRELSRRRRAGQHLLAEEYGRTLSRQQLSPSVLDDVHQFLFESAQNRELISKAKALLIDRQAKLTDATMAERLQPLRSEINEQLSIDSLERLDPFLKAEGDTTISAEQHLALAYSGWIVGAANAVTNLQTAISLWDARFEMIEYVRADTVQERDQHHQQLRNIEGVGPNLILQVAAQLPPALDSQGVVSGESFRIRVTPEGHSPEIAYSVLLPNEYSPLKNYPMIVLLRSKGRTNEQLLRWWGGSSEHPGVGMNRGYVLIAPEYAEEKETEYSYRAEVHSVVIESLRDARRRFSIDSDRVFLAGHGMGADAAFDLGMAHPDEFAGVIPISGSCALHPRYTYENGKYTAWYVIGRGFSDDFKDTQNNAVFDEIFRRGPRFDFMLIEYLGRGMDGYQEEIPKIFDWMDLHRRISVPQEFEVATLRKSDNQYFWLSAVNLPRTITLSHSTKGRVNKMGIDGKITPGNRVVVRSAADKFVVRFPSGLIDFEKRVTVSINGRDKFKGFITPDIQSILEELRVTGDKTRLPLSTMEF